ncbi:MAG: hypothetical protein JNM93_04385 [Bacteriovoracaceae bacterium]|nr:hypothetical protein [Bacteriovoracaceae bacterium]
MTEKKTRKKTAKKKNPLYMVDEKTNVVEEVKSLIDFVVKKFNLEETFATLLQILQTLIESIQTYPMFQAVMQFIDGLMDQVEAWLGGFQSGATESETGTVHNT